jgi:NADPH2:quinone reductase
MRAAWYDRLGQASDIIQLGELLTPSPGPDEVLVRLHASGVNPADVKRRVPNPNAEMEFPRIIPNSDGAGVVAAIGAAVSPAWTGQRVWLFNGQRFRAFGTAAEYICLPSWHLSVLPAGTSMAEGACLGIPCMTAHRAVFGSGQVAGKRVLVTGGAGAVGNYAVQWAKWGGAAQIIATVSNPTKAADATDAGADLVVNYRRDDVAAAVRTATGGAGVDLVVDVDLAGNLDATLACLAPAATIACYASAGALPDGFFFRLARQNVVLQTIVLNTIPRQAMAQAQRDITSLLASGLARHRIAGRFSLDQIVAAHEAVEAGEKRGTVVVEIEQD